MPLVAPFDSSRRRALRRGAWRLAGVLSVTATAATPLSAEPARTPPTLLVIGDSLSAEYGLPRGAGWVALLAARLGTRYEVVNASISGETTAGGATRVAELLARHRPAIALIELGGNDALRGLDLAQTRANLEGMVAKTRAAGAVPVLVGVQVPPNYGRRYTEAFAGVFRELATAQRVPLVPQVLAGLENRPDLFQADRIHPSQAAQPVLLENVWAVLKELLGAGKA